MKKFFSIFLISLLGFLAFSEVKYIEIGSKSKGIEDTEFFYYCERNSFRAPEDAEDAYKNGFVLYTAVKTGRDYMSGQNYTAVVDNHPRNKESDAYYAAKKLGYTNYADYEEYLNYTAEGFKTKDEYLNAKARGFLNAEQMKNAGEAGFINNNEYQEAKNLGLQKKTDLTSYKEITREIDRIIEERKIPKKHAAVYYFIRKLPKGEMSLSVLSKTLAENYSIINPDVKNALKEFFGAIDITQLGTYSSQSEIFKKK